MYEIKLMHIDGRQLRYRKTDKKKAKKIVADWCREIERNKSTHIHYVSVMRLKHFNGTLRANIIDALRCGNWSEKQIAIFFDLSTKFVKIFLVGLLKCLATCSICV